MSNSTHRSSNASLADEPHRTVLLTVYTVVLLGGSVGIVFMISILKSSLRSLTTIAMLNIIAVHLLFLWTVPFRMYYYVSNRWEFSQGFCKVVSGMIHGHTYITFLFYGIILSIRYYTFYRAVDQLEFYRKLHAVGASLMVWAVGVAIGFPVLLYTYGSNSTADSKCFNFGERLERDVSVQALNYVVSIVVVVAVVTLAYFQAHILWRIFRRYGATMYTQQEFGAQKKSLCFMLVIMVCFVPYHVFRIYYVSHSVDLEDTNEVFLSLTALSCLDTLTFLSPGMFCS